jgi:hypothetical protein
MLRWKLRGLSIKKTIWNFNDLTIQQVEKDDQKNLKKIKQKD